MLIIGESHYHDNSEESKSKHENPLYTKVVINELAIGRQYWSTRIFQSLHRTLFLNDNFDPRKFWGLVSYYNFIQRPMKTNKGRPTNKEFLDSWSTFFDIIGVLKPNIYLFVGNTAANQLLKAIPNSGYSCESVRWEDQINGAYAKTASIFDEKGEKTRMIFIKHTSQRFTYEKWNNFLIKVIGNQLEWLQRRMVV